MTSSGISWPNLKGLIDSCYVPVLKEDLDDVPLLADHFIEYRKILEIQLPIVYDLLQQNQQLVFESDEQDACETLANLLILLCEVTAQNTIYGLSYESILRNANRILCEHTPVQRMVVERIIFEYYQKKLKKDAWKRQLGAIHGFLRFLQLEYFAKHYTFHYNFSKLQYGGQPLQKQWVHFCLSVGLTVRESHEPTYKKIGAVIFHLLLNSGDFSYLQEQNIHSVIYHSVYKDVDFLESVDTAVVIWNCLYTCLRFFDDLDSFRWSYLDDLIEKALKNITMANSNLISLCHLQFVVKLGAYFAINREDILNHCEADLSDPTALNQCRAICATNNSYTIFRWAKDILNMFNVNSYILMQDKEISQKFLLELHKCYLVYIVPIKLEIIGSHLTTFLEKFTAALMEVIITHKKDIEIIKLIRAILETFKLHLHHSPDLFDNVEFTNLHNALDKLLGHNVFVQNK